MSAGASAGTEDVDDRLVTEAAIKVEAVSETALGHAGASTAEKRATWQGTAPNVNPIIFSQEATRMQL